MKKIELKMKVAKIVSKLTSKLLEEGYFIVETHKSGVPKIEAIEFMHPSKESKKAIFVTYERMKDYLQVQEVIVSVGEMEKETSLFFLSRPDGEVSFEIISKFLVYTVNTGQKFLTTKKELLEMDVKRTKRFLSKLSKSHQFEAPKFKTIKGFKRSGGLVTRLTNQKTLTYSVATRKGIKVISFAG